MKVWIIRIWVIIDLLIVLSTLALWLAAPTMWTLNISLTIFSIFLTGILIYPQREEIKTFVKSHYFKKLLGLFVNIGLVFAIVGLVNYLGNRKAVEVDVTQRQLNTIAPQSLKVLEMLKSPVKITLFAKREDWAQYLGLLKLFTSQSSKIQLEAIDMDLKPQLAREKGITQSGTIEVTTDKTSMQLLLDSELTLTNALLKTLRDRPIKIYFTTGHNELSCQNTEADGLSLFCQALTATNYELAKLDLMKESVIPSDADVVIVAGPESSFLKEEVERLENYLVKGGSLLMALAPSFETDRYQNLRELMKRWGLDIKNDLVLDRLSTVQGADATIPLINNYASDHELTKDLKARSLFPMSSSIGKVQMDDEHIHASLLALTTSFPGSWGESDLPAVASGKAQFDGKDSKGPVAVLAAAEKHHDQSKNKETRIVLSGSSSALVNAYFQQEGNRKIFTQSVAWLSFDEGILSFNKVSESESPVILSAIHLNLVFVVSIILVPVIFWALAFLMYRKRRQL